jgi:hypothetical protein
MLVLIFAIQGFLLIFLGAGWYNEYLNRCDYEKAYLEEYEEKRGLTTQLLQYKHLAESFAIKKPVKRRKSSN